MSSLLSRFPSTREDGPLELCSCASDHRQKFLPTLLPLVLFFLFLGGRITSRLGQILLHFFDKSVPFFWSTVAVTF